MRGSRGGSNESDRLLDPFPDIPRLYIYANQTLQLLLQLQTDTALTTLGAQPHAPASGRSRPSEKNRGGGAEWRAGTGSPRKTFALARCRQHEMMPYHRQISAEESRPKDVARAKASFFVKPTVSLAQ